jgi:hypothetical protein
MDIMKGMTAKIEMVNFPSFRSYLKANSHYKILESKSSSVGTFKAGMDSCGVYFLCCLHENPSK